MKRMTLVAVLVCVPFMSTPGAAQDSEPRAVTVQAAPDRQAAPKVVGGKPRGRTDADARACLDLKTNREIIVCAEKYL
jgi:hypothetical protein